MGYLAARIPFTADHPQRSAPSLWPQERFCPSSTGWRIRRAGNELSHVSVGSAIFISWFRHWQEQLASIEARFQLSPCTRVGANCGFGAANPSGNAWKEWSYCAKLPTPMIPLPRDFQDFLRLLNANAIRYLVIGGYAVAYHGYVRYTGDLDI
jgi:hypothetical protein